MDAMPAGARADEFDRIRATRLDHLVILRAGSARVEAAPMIAPERSASKRKRVLSPTERASTRERCLRALTLALQLPMSPSQL